ncbi:MAG TPA: hypothetical protein V6D29_06825 [Leptolyngbyaceae cyanobacterium]
MAEQGGKFNIGKVLKQARQPDDQITKQPENQLPEQEQKESQLSGKPDDQITKQPEKQVNLCVKVPESHRRYWAAMAKLQGITMTDVMVEALTQKFGLPDNQKGD